MEREAAQYAEAKTLLDNCGISREQLTKEKAEAYEAVAGINREIRAARKEIAMCGEIVAMVPVIEKSIGAIENVRKAKEKTKGVGAMKSEI